MTRGPRVIAKRPRMERDTPCQVPRGSGPQVSATSGGDQAKAKKARTSRINGGGTEEKLSDPLPREASQAAGPLHRDEWSNQVLTTCQALRAPVAHVIAYMTSWMRKLKLRKPESLTQGHTAFQE